MKIDSTRLLTSASGPGLGLVEQHADVTRPAVTGRHTVTLLSRGLALGAAPVFAVMAVLAGSAGHESAAMPGMDMASPCPSPLTGMALMYALMSVFHLAPWLKLAALRHRH